MRRLAPLLLALGMATAMPAHAQKADLRTDIAMSQADIQRNFTLQDFPSPHDPFSFNILVPRGWLWFEKEGRPKVPDGKLQLLIAFGDRTDKSLVEVSALQIEREITPAEWLHEWLKLNKYEVLASRIVPSAAGRNADVKARKQVDGRSVIFRIRTFKNGRYIYVLHSFSDAETYPQVEEAFLVAAETFELTKVPQQAYAEPMQDIALDKVFGSGFKAPASWSATPDTDTGPDSQSWTLTNKRGGDAIGILNVFTAPLALFKDEAAVAEMSGNWLRKHDITFPGVPLKPVNGGPGGVRIAASEQKVEIDGRPGLVRQTIMRTNKGWALFTLATKAMEPDPYMVAAINRRGLDIAYNSFLSAIAPQ